MACARNSRKARDLGKRGHRRGWGKDGAWLPSPYSALYILPPPGQGSYTVSFSNGMTEAQKS